MTEPTVQGLSPAERRSALEAFQRTLRRESHVLYERPDLLWQQLYNRLQWEDEPVPRLLAPEFARRSVPGAGPWLHLRTPLRESNALVRSLVHKRVRDVDTQRIKDLAISPDGTWCISTSGEGTLTSPTTRQGRQLITHRQQLFCPMRELYLDITP